MTDSLPYPPPQTDDQELLRDAFYDLEYAGWTTLPGDIHAEQFIHWLRRYRGLDGVEIHEQTATALILRKD